MTTRSSTLTKRNWSEEELRSASVEDMVPSVMTTGITEMLLLFADKWDSLFLVSSMLKR